jgi:hypothetical protein
MESLPGGEQGIQEQAACMLVLVAPYQSALEFSILSDRMSSYMGPVLTLIDRCAAMEKNNEERRKQTHYKHGGCCRHTLCY